MIELLGQYFDGKTSTRQSAKLVLLDSSAELIAEDLHLSFGPGEFRLRPRLANIVARFEFNDGAVFEAGEQPGLDKAYQQLHQAGFHKLVHKLENKLGYILLTLVVAIGVMLGLVQYGIPQFARSVAYTVPLEFETRMGEESLTLIDTSLCKASKLDMQRQHDLSRKMLALLGSADGFRIEFRSCETIGANALALPSGIIIFTDDMVKLAKHDHELLGVFAHEVGHIAYRHTLRHVLQDSITSLLIVMLTGDVGSASSMAAALPTILLQTKFSRDFEREADQYAAEFLLSKKLQPAMLANLLKRLDKEFGTEEIGDSFLSTHPLTKERISFLTSTKNKTKKGESDE